MADYAAPDYIYLSSSAVGLLIPTGLDPDGVWVMYDNRGNSSTFHPSASYVHMAVSESYPTKFMFSNALGAGASEYTEPVYGKRYPDVRMDKTDGTKFRVGGIPTEADAYGYLIYGQLSDDSEPVLLGEIEPGAEYPFVDVVIQEDEQMKFYFINLIPPTYQSPFSPYYSGFVAANPPSDLRREGNFDSHEFVISWQNNGTISDPYDDFMALQARVPDVALGGCDQWRTVAAVDTVHGGRNEARFDSRSSEWYVGQKLEFRVYVYTVVLSETLYSEPLENQFGRPIQHRLLSSQSNKASVFANWNRQGQEAYEKVAQPSISLDVMKIKDGTAGPWIAAPAGHLSTALFTTEHEADEAASYKIRTSVSYDMPDGVARTTDPVETPPIEVGFAPEKPVVEYDKESFSASIVLPEDDTGSSPNKRTVKMYLNGNVSSEHLQEADSGHTLDAGKVLPSSSFSLSAGVRTDFWPDEVMSEQVDIEFDGTALIIGDKRYGVYLIRYGEPVVPVAIHAI